MRSLARSALLSRPFPYSGNLSQAPLFVAQASSRRNDGKGWRTIVSVRGSRFLLCSPTGNHPNSFTCN
ncbi:hypothetical protein HYQ45_011385 [Verticillium longisporum]|uniref:Uncharacterized protein n=1 Tax=Verticillium longisporum TaxID=100787 RepID=A0A8I2ZEJ4_VERLO|nr:hypothetical protein HYQ44_014777 [Verticillium longisporum]KAG7129361.1 hypothetical protein HYQ45_011385 [Verticillium longisporum]KAG7137431.1 hypothetical protein HYQ46_008535 [Verticillium longisporum]